MVIFKLQSGAIGAIVGIGTGLFGVGLMGLGMSYPVTSLAGFWLHAVNEVQADAAAGVQTLPEWVDVIILGFDGAWRSGATPEQIVAAIVAKQTKNEGRRWPDWRTADRGKAIEHDRSADVARTWREALAALPEPTADASAEVERLRQALRDIADPIAAWQRDLQPGYTLDGGMCVHMANDPETYKRMAREALRA